MSYLEIIYLVRTQNVLKFSYVCVSGAVSGAIKYYFFGNFAYALNEWTPCIIIITITILRPNLDNTVTLHLLFVDLKLEGTSEETVKATLKIEDGLKGFPSMNIMLFMTSKLRYNFV